MRIVLVADIHANLAALEAVLRHAAGGGPVDRIWAMGDIVGYGPDPCECIALLRSHPHTAVAGNHDRAAVGQIGISDFNPYAAAAVEWTAKQLGETERDYLSGLADVMTEADFTLVHGTLMDPVWEYLLSAEQALGQFALQATPYGLVGHSHLQMAYIESADEPPRAVRFFDKMTLKLGDERFVCNPGGLGQPRDGDSRACYALLDTDERLIRFHRVKYDIGATQRKMEKAGLPRMLIDRLARGR